MKVAHITPTAHLNEILTADHDYHLVLTKPTIEDGAYRAFYQKALARGNFVILDNDAHEMKNALWDTKIEGLKAAAHLLGPSEIVLPDKFGTDIGESLDLMQAGLDAFDAPAWQDCSFMAVPRAQTLEGFYECLYFMAEQPRITSIGITYMTEREHDVSREAIVRQVRSNGVTIPLHLLGEGSELTSSTSLYLCLECRGIDTAKFVNWGLRGYNVSRYRRFAHEGRIPNYFNHIAESTDVRLARFLAEYWSAQCAI